MKIKLEYPFSADWTSGYVVRNSENRTVLCLVKKGKRASTSYARYLMSIKLGRYLNNNEHADHIDEDKTNDDISNLQVLTPRENIRKSAKRQKLVTLVCPICNKEFTIPNRQNWGENRKRTCSKKCGYQKTANTLRNKHPKRFGKNYHGKNLGYSYYKCRCTLCTEAHRLHCKKYKKG